MGWMLLPAKAGTCHFCATAHGQDEPHNYWSLFYQTRFTLAYGRGATHADAVAHLPDRLRDVYREVLSEAGQEWSEPGPGSKTVREPYAESTGDNIRRQEV